MKTCLFTELLHLLGPDHAGPVAAPGLGHLPHPAPGEGGGVKLESGGQVVANTVCFSSCMGLQLTTYPAYVHMIRYKLTRRDDLVV